MKLRPSERLLDWLPWLYALDPEQPEVILTSSGGLLRVAKLQAPDFETATPEAMLEHQRQLAAAFARYGNGWSLWIDQWRTQASAYLPECDFNGSTAAQLIDASRRRFFSNLNKPVFANSAFLAVHYQPQVKDALLGWIMDRQDSQTQGNVRFFLENSSALFGQLAYAMRGLEILQGDALANYLSASVTYQPARRVRFPAGLIARGLASREWHLGEQIRIDDRWMATVEVRDFGRDVTPVQVEALHELPFEARWCMTMHGLNADQRRKEFLEVRKRWATKQKGPLAVVGEAISGMFGRKVEGRIDPEVSTALADLDQMQAELARRPFALATFNVHVWGSSAAQAAANAAFVTAKLRDVGLEARQATLNAAWALLGDMPGAVGTEVANLRQSREEIPVITCLSPVTGVSDGCRSDWRFNGPALLVGLTRRQVPLYWSLNDATGSDFAHTGIIGKSGGGKSTLLAFMAAQFMRYAGARVILFDRRRSFLVTCCCLGGDWLELGGGGLGVQPLRAVHLPEERAWAHGWVLKALLAQGMELQPHTDSAVSDALSHVADRPPEERTLTRLHTYLAGDNAARQALKAYLSGGSYGRLFDGVVDSYGSRSVVGIETQNIVGLERVAPLVMSSVFRAIRRDRLGGDSPKLVVIDEAWSFLQDDLFAGEITSWALELRKLKAVLVLATQSLSHFDSARTQAIFDQLGNRIYMPHAEAMRSDAFEMYRAKGLQEEQIRALSQARPKGEMLLQTEQVTRLLSVQLTDDALAICGAIGSDHQARAFSLLRQGAQPGEEFTAEWLRESTADWCAANLEWEQAA